MKCLKLILCSVLIYSQLGHADSEFSQGFPHISKEAFRSRFILKGELFLTDASGKILLAPTTDIREWRPGLKATGISADWITKAKGIRDVIVHFEMDIRDDKSVKMTIKQYDSAKTKADHSNTHYGKLIREQSMDLENFSPISWVAETGSDYRVILRFVPDLDTIRDGTSLDKLTIGGDRGSFMVTDNQGFLWGEGVRFGGVISGLSSHRGAFVISFYPFKGAKELGFAMGKQIELNLSDKLKVTIRNDENMIPEAMKIKVYGKYIPNSKTSSSTSHYSFGQETVDQVPKEFGL